MVVFENVAKATLQIQCGESLGSGFHLVDVEYVATNFHVVSSCMTNGEKVFARTESGNKVELELLASSPKEEHDYAIFKTKECLKEERIALEPKIIVPARGMQVCFAGFPHGINDLLVQSATVSGPFENLGFYIDGSVNGGNSGGPIVDINDMKAIGIVTRRRFLTPKDLNRISNNLNAVKQHLEQMSGKMRVEIMGLDIGRFGQLMSDSLDCFKDIVELNANTGIGIGYRTEFIGRAFEQIYKA